MAFLAARSLDDAFAALEGGDFTLIAGGTDLFPQWGERRPKVSLLDVNGLPGFRGVTHGPQGWRIGAATPWSDVIAADLPPAFDGLKAAAREIGAVQIQNTGTLGGNLCNASPAADGVPPLLALNATVELVSRAGMRHLPLDRFITGVRRTELRPAEILSAVLVPDQPRLAVSGFRKLGARRYLVISIAMVAAALVVQRGRVTGARVAVGACSPVARRLPVLEARLEGHQAGRALPLDNACLEGLAPIDDIRATSDYRADAVQQMVRRLLSDLIEQGVRADG